MGGRRKLPEREGR